VLIEGLQPSAFSSTIEMDINLELARNSGAAYINVLQGHERSAQEILDEILIDHEKITASGCVHFATFANRLDVGVDATLRSELNAHDLPIPIYLLNEIDELDMPTVREVETSLGCTRIWGESTEMRRVVRNTRIAAMRLEHFLEYLEEGDLVLVPGDRSDIVVGAIMAASSDQYPAISGILLSGGQGLSSAVMRMLEGSDPYAIPILAFGEDTYKTALKVEGVVARIGARSERKIALAMGLFNGAVDYDHLSRKIA
jgi:phosphate acetyltransferase